MQAEEQRREQGQQREGAQIAPGRAEPRRPVLPQEADQIAQADARHQQGADTEFLPAPKEGRQPEEDAQDQQAAARPPRIIFLGGEHQGHAADRADGTGLGEVHAQIAVGCEGEEDQRRLHQGREEAEAAQQHPGDGRKAQDDRQILAQAVPVEAVAEGGVEALENGAQKDVDIGDVNRLMAELAVDEFGHEQVVVRLPHGGKKAQHGGKKEEIDAQSEQNSPISGQLVVKFFHAPPPPFRIR